MKKLSISIIIIIIAIMGVGFTTPNVDIASAEARYFTNNKDTYADITYSYIISSYSSLTKQYKIELNNKYDIIDSQLDDIVLRITQFFEGMEYKVEYNPSINNTVLAIKTYDSLTDYYIEMGITGFEVNEPQVQTIDKGLLFNVHHMEMSSYLTGLKSMKILEGLIGENGWLSNLGLDNVHPEDKENPALSYDDINWHYIYGSAFKVENPSTMVSHSGDLYLVSYLYLNDASELILSRQYPNSIVWYTAIIVIGIVVVIVSAVSINIYKKKKI